MPVKNDGRRELGDRTRQRLLQATRTLLAERGLGAVHLRDVSGAAGVNVAAVSYHFGSLPNLVQAAVREAVDAVMGEQARRLASLPTDAGLADIVAAWIEPTVRGLQQAPEDRALLRIVAQAITDAPEEMREWVQDVLGRGHGLLIARLRPALPGLGEQELAFRVFCVGGVVNRLLTAASLPESAAVTSPEFQQLLVAAAAGMLAGPGNDVLS
jgi:AcrR family transcriptional regulator